MREIDDMPFGEGPVEAAKKKQSPPPEKQSPPPEAQSPPPSPKRKRRAPRPEPAVEEENARPATRKERMKEKVDCDHCGKQITRHAQLYTHAKNCKGQTQQPKAYEPSSPKQSLASYVPREPPQPKAESSALLQRPQPAPDEEFMERLRRASLAYQQLDRQKHSSLIRNFYGY